MCLSIKNTISDQKNIEVLVAHDKDDRETMVSKYELISTFKPWLKFFPRERSSNLSKDYYNWLYDFSQGKYILVMNDDCQIINSNWDKFAYEKLIETNWKDQIFLGITYPALKLDLKNVGNKIDSKHVRNCINLVETKTPINNITYSSFPILTRETIEILGYIFPPPFGGWSNDIYLGYIFQRIYRHIHLPEIKIKHLSFRTGRPKDSVSLNVGEISKNSTGIIDINEEISKLKSKIKIISHQ
jgi:hypothetical protein